MVSFQFVNKKRDLRVGPWITHSDVRLLGEGRFNQEPSMTKIKHWRTRKQTKRGQWQNSHM